MASSFKRYVEPNLEYESILERARFVAAARFHRQIESPSNGSIGYERDFHGKQHLRHPA